MHHSPRASAAPKSNRGSAAVQPDADPTTIEEGYTPSLIGRIVEMHASYYSKLVGFGVMFESKVADGLADFMTRLEHDENAIWYARNGERIVGSITIDGEDLGAGRAHLRWFIVDDGVRGTGVGGSLIRDAMAFCDDRNFRETDLWTFAGLTAARRLYEKHGFSLTEEYYGDQWGDEVLEQKFVRPLHR